MNPNMWENPVQRKLREGGPVVACTITVPSAEVAAQAAGMGFDFLWVEMEHSPITLETLRNMVLSTRGLPAMTFARVPVNQLWTAKRVLDAGVAGVIFPFTTTPELARQAVAACRYPPAGRRGSGATLAKSTWPDPDRYTDSAAANVMVIAVIEEARAVEQIDEIAATPGLGALFIGTSDLAFSLGLRGDQNHPALREAVAKVLEAGRRHGVAVGRPAITREKREEFFQQGFRLFQGPTDLGLMGAAAARYLAREGA